jgi:hypothetical protein
MEVLRRPFAETCTSPISAPAKGDMLHTVAAKKSVKRWCVYTIFLPVVSPHLSSTERSLKYFKPIFVMNYPC